MPGAPVPKLAPYDKLISFVNSLNVGNFKDICTEFCYNLDDDMVVNGAYRELEEYVLILAEMYIDIDRALADNSFLKEFGSVPYHFRLAIGADGCPFGKDDEATSWLLSFMNVGEHVASPYDNFIICGANCSESHVAMERYARKLIQDIAHLEAKIFDVNNNKVQFTCELVPSDMKWLAHYSGELTNAAYYFSSFANVNTDNMYIVNGAIGTGTTDTWKPWQYAQRVTAAKQVSAKKVELSNPRGKKAAYAPSTQRQKLLEFIKQQNHRQEYLPILGPLVDCAFAEPLHNSNNSWLAVHPLTNM